MFPRLVFPNRHPFAPRALPQITARMGGSDFNRHWPLPRFLHLSEAAGTPAHQRPDLPGYRIIPL